MNPLVRFLALLLGVSLGMALASQSAHAAAWSSASSGSGFVFSTVGSTVKSASGGSLVASGEGGVLLRGLQTYTLGASRVPVVITLERAMTSSALASAAARVAMRLGPIGTIATILQGAQWVYENGQWLRPAEESEGMPYGRYCDGATCGSYDEVQAFKCAKPSLFGSAGCLRWEPAAYNSNGSVKTTRFYKREGGTTNFDAGYSSASCPLGTHLVGTHCVPDAGVGVGEADLQSKLNSSLQANPGTAPGVASDTFGGGEGVDAGPVTSSGPAQVQGPTATTTHANGDTTSTTTNYNITYNNAGDTSTVNVTSTTTSTTTNNAGDVIGQETTTTDSDVDTGAAVEPATLGDVPQLYERKYPDGIVGVWNDHREQLEQNPLSSLMSALTPNWGDGGGCPSFQFNPGAVLGIDVSGDVSPPCFVWPVLRWVFIVSSLFAARRIVFGG